MFKISIAAIAIGMTIGAGIGAGVSHADPVRTINLTDIQNVEELPVCAVEDCSDQPYQIGMWLDRDTGNWYYSAGEESYLVIDNTVK